MLTLYQFTFSHFCGKARWALDYKGLPYTPRNLLPGLHRRVVLRLARKSTVLLLIDNGEIIQGSTEIIDHLDGRYPEYPLTPATDPQAKESREWEAYLDDEVGVPLRLWGYYHLLPDGLLPARIVVSTRGRRTCRCPAEGDRRARRSAQDAAVCPVGAPGARRTPQRRSCDGQGRGLRLRPVGVASRPRLPVSYTLSRSMSDV